MLKWLRKYNTYILVVGGCLLMVAFLLPQTIEQLGRSRFGGKVMKVSGSNINAEEYTHAVREHAALRELLGGPEFVRAAGGGDNVDHWIMLTREAEQAGLIGGVNDGSDFIHSLSRGLAQQLFGQYASIMPQVIDQQAGTIEARITASIPRAAADAHFSQEQVLKALARLHGVIRLRNAYYDAPRFSDRRLIADAKALSDAFGIDYVAIPAEREMTGIAEPDDAAIKAHFEKFRETPKGGGEFGVGYQLPPRVKLSWLKIDRKAIADTVSADPVEVQKRFLKQFPTGSPPAGTSAADVTSRLQAEIKAEQVAKVIKAANQAVRAEIGRFTRRLEQDGDYYKLPADARADMVKIATAMVNGVSEQTGVNMPSPTVSIREREFLDAPAVRTLEGIGQSSLNRGNRSESFENVALAVREIAGKNDIVLQVGVPYPEPTVDADGNQFFFVVLDARKQSPPDSLDEVRAEVIRNIKRIAAFEKLKAAEPALLQRAITDGLDSLTKAPDGATGDAAVALAVKKATIEKGRSIPEDPAINSQALRDRVVALGNQLDPLVDPAKADPAKTTFASPVPSALSLVVGRITSISPMTYERFRSRQPGIVAALRSREIGGEATPESDPFSIQNIEKRLNVEYFDGRKTSTDQRDSDKRS